MQNGISKVVFGAKQLVREKFLESYCTAFMLLNKLTEVDLYKFLERVAGILLRYLDCYDNCLSNLRQRMRWRRISQYASSDFWRCMLQRLLTVVIATVVIV